MTSGGKNKNQCPPAEPSRHRGSGLPGGGRGGPGPQELPLPMGLRAGGACPAVAVVLVTSGPSSTFPVKWHPET